ncbi:MAG: DHHW family protein [Clostridia bacterium]|nr:DHHW family protein [Clostridia bacterium]
MKNKNKNENVTNFLLKSRLEKENKGEKINVTPPQFNKKTNNLKSNDGKSSKKDFIKEPKNDSKSSKVPIKLIEAKPYNKNSSKANKENIKNKITAALLILIALLIIFVAIFRAKMQTEKKEEITTIQKQTETVAPNNSVSQTTQTTKPTAPTTEAKYEIKSSILVQGTRAMEIYYVSPKSLQRYAGTLNTFANKVPGVNVYSIIAPTSVEFYGPSKYRTGSHSQIKGIQIASDAMNSKIKKVYVRDNLEKHKNEYLYFRTDHHWTARGAYYAYETFASSAGFSHVSLSSHQSGRLNDFVGSYYRYTKDDVLKKNPDYVEFFKPTTSTTATVYNDASMTGGYEIKVINDGVTASNKYLAFIGGDHALLKIKTNVSNGRKIVLIKESYGNAFAPFLCNNFSEVYVVDPRKFNSKLDTFVKNNNITDVVFLNYTFAMSNPTYMKGLTAMLV